MHSCFTDFDSRAVRNRVYCGFSVESGGPMEPITARTRRNVEGSLSPAGGFATPEAPDSRTKSFRAG